VLFSGLLNSAKVLVEIDSSFGTAKTTNVLGWLANFLKLPSSGQKWGEFMR
jgi:hypothetical protein